MKYESNILERLIKTYGVVGNPKYVSEIIKQFIIQGKECYPNLFTYQSDWLAHIDEFGLENDYVVTYTGQHFYAPNTKESPVKRAILKGSTLVNLYQFKSTNTATLNTTYEYNDNKYIVTNNGNDGYVKTDITVYLEANKTYTFKAKCDKGFNNDNGYIYLLLNNSSSNGKKMANENTTFRVSTSGIYYVRLDVRASSEPYIFSDLMILEGDYTKQDIPYFEGMQSVKLPVLTTSNEDGTKTNILTVNEDVTLRDIKDTKYFNGSSIGKKFTDVLDCINGELKIQTNKVTMDGNKQPILSISKENVSIFKYKPNDILINSSYDGGTIFICDKLKFVSSLWEKDEEGYCYSNNDGIMFSISNNKFTDINEYLSQNPISFIYPLAQESIKTVDLNIKDQNNQVVNHLTSFEGGTHFDTSSQTGSVLPTLEVDVVVDLEETLMVCSTEGNTM